MDTNPHIRLQHSGAAPAATERIHWSAWVALAALLIVGALFWSFERRNAAGATLLGAAGCLALILPPRERMRALPWRLRAVPRRLDGLPVVATLLSAPGYGLNWFYGVNPYDEVVHLVSGVLAGLVLAAVIGADGLPRSRGRMLLLGAMSGLALAAVWEGFEWATGLIGGLRDTWTDVLLTTIGVAAACALSPRKPVGRSDARRDL